MSGAPPAMRGRGEQARRERVEVRRAQVLAAAARLMERAGYHAVSMQAIADEAGISVGLIYQYFGGKEDVLRALIVDVLEAFRDQVPQRVALAGPDPRDRLAAGFEALCRIIDTKRDATVLAYRESGTLSAPARSHLKRLEIETVEPIRAAVADGVRSGVFRTVDTDVAVHSVLMAAHGWALKHWHLAPLMSHEEYLQRTLDLLVSGLAGPD